MNREARKLTYRVELPGGVSRLREMILYVSRLSAEMPRFGKTKLNKILWSADFSAFANRGTPVTGRPYQKLENGPAPVEMPHILAEMEQSGFITIELTDFGQNMVEHRIVPKVLAGLHYFSEDDIHYVKKAIERFWDLNARQSSDSSHGIAWKTREELDPMPYEAAIFSDAELGGRTLERLKSMGRERGWTSQ